MSNQFTTPELLRKKRDGEKLSEEEINWFIQEMVHQRIEDCQIGAMLMAMCINGLSDEETMHLTTAIISSGEQLQWNSEWSDLLVDKHSTGGCGDKVSLVLAPALAAYGLKVPMISGRGLGYTGGTLDKLESIPGFQVQLSEEEMKIALDKVGCFIAGSTPTLTPGDKELYKRRDVTATVDNTSLIVASIISKKVAEGTKALVMDLKVGSGAFFKTIPEAEILASKLIKVSSLLGVKIKVALTRMDTPIGRNVGNSLEVAESVECLKGKGPSDLMELVTSLGGIILQMKKLVKTLNDGKEAISKIIYSGEALTKFHDMLIYQGVTKQVAETLCNKDMWSVLPSVSPENITIIKAHKTGNLKNVDAMKIAKVNWLLGAGRSRADQSIDVRVGIRLLCVQGDNVKENDGILEIHHSTKYLDAKIKEELEDAIVITETSVPLLSPIIAIV